MLAGTIPSVVVGILLYALAIWVVGKLGLGLKVSGFTPWVVLIFPACVLVISLAILFSRPSPHPSPSGPRRTVRGRLTPYASNYSWSGRGILSSVKTGGP